MVLLGVLAPLALTVFPSSTFAQASFHAAPAFTSVSCTYVTEPYYTPPTCTTITVSYSQITSPTQSCSFSGSISSSTIVEGTPSVTASGFDSCGPTVNIGLSIATPGYVCGSKASSLFFASTAPNAADIFSQIIPTSSLAPGHYCVWMASPCTAQGCVAPYDIFDPLTVEPPATTVATTPLPSCDLSVAKSFAPESVSVGQTADVTVTVTNASPQTCQPASGAGWEVLDNLPSGLNMSNIAVAYPPSGWQCANWNKPAGPEVQGFSCASTMALPPSYSATFTFQVVAVGPPGSYNNCAYAYQNVVSGVYVNPSSAYPSTNGCALFTVAPAPAASTASASTAPSSPPTSPTFTANNLGTQTQQSQTPSSRASEIEAMIAAVAVVFAVGFAIYYGKARSGGKPAPSRSAEPQSKTGDPKKAFCPGCGGRLPDHYPFCPRLKKAIQDSGDQ